MIPKVIHYCWFGGASLPSLAIKCINSWKKYFPDYEIVRWDETNFDVNMMDYTREAYQAKNFAFVSDVARFWILYYHGGIYFDTDVEVIKSFNNILSKGAFMGCETSCSVGKPLWVAPGLGMGAEVGHVLYEQMLNRYRSIHFLVDGKMKNETVVNHMTQLLKRHGLQEMNVIQEIAGITIYPKDYMCPMSTEGRVMNVTSNTVSIHHYAKSWVGTKSKIKKIISIALGPSITMFIIKTKRILMGKNKK